MGQDEAAEQEEEIDAQVSQLDGPGEPAEIQARERLVHVQGEDGRRGGRAQPGQGRQVVRASPTHRRLTPGRR